MSDKKPAKQDKKENKPKEAPVKKERVTGIVRLVETNIDSAKPVKAAIRSIRGISFMFSNAVSRVSGFGDKKLADLSEQEIHTLEDIIAHPERHGIPVWIYNRRNDPIKGGDGHLSVSKLELTQRMDINEMKKLKSYRGIRHIYGLPVRGQRTGSGSGGKVVGVSKKKQQPSKKK